MARTKTTLADALAGWRAEQQARGLAANTIRTMLTTGNRLLNRWGAAQAVESLTTEQWRNFIHGTPGGRVLQVKPKSLVLELCMYRSFCEYLGRQGSLHESVARERYLFAYKTPTQTPKFRLPAAEWPALLDAASCPRDRILIAMGLYTLGRSSEILAIRLRDIDLTAERPSLAMSICKTRETDEAMPIVCELEHELRVWLTYYTEQVGDLKPSYHLIPADKAVVAISTRDDAGQFIPGWARERGLNPTRPLGNAYAVVKAALAEIGYVEELDHDGGMHALRRSAARAIYEQLVAEGYPDPLRTIMAVLHHRSVQTTETYLGITADKARRNARFAGRYMFPANDPANRENVVPLRSVGEGQ